jgi:hypothetical protein
MVPFAGQPSSQGSLPDPLNDHGHQQVPAYKAEALSRPEVHRLNTISSDALATLQKEFPFGVQRSDGTVCLFWCTEKPHSMLHWASNWRTVGAPRTISTNVTESRMKTAVETKAKKTNKHRSAAASSMPTWRWRRRSSWHTTWTQQVCPGCIGVGLLVFLLGLPERG